MYRDVMCRGGIPTPEFAKAITFGLRSKGYVEDVAAMLQKYPFMNEYWEKDKRPDFEKIELPMYMVASWTSGVHVYGTLRAWNLIASKEKWLRVHNTQEWPDQQTPKYRDELRKFFDYYLKGIENDWVKTPKVRVCLHDPTGVDIVDHEIDGMPAASTKYERLYLDCGNMSLGSTPSLESSHASYSADGGETLQFRIKLDRDVNLCGYFKARIFMSTNRGDNIDLFMYVNKEDSMGVTRYFETLGCDFTGASARLRVSHRKVTNDAIYDFCHDTNNAQLLSEGEVTEIETVFWPMGMVCRKGEALVLTISPNNMRKLEFPAPPVKTINQGDHTVHSGGEYHSYIDIPAIDL
jgi:hypothetical protein